MQQLSESDPGLSHRVLRPDAADAVSATAVVVPIRGVDDAVAAPTGVHPPLVEFAVGANLGRQLGDVAGLGVEFLLRVATTQEEEEEEEEDELDLHRLSLRQAEIAYRIIWFSGDYSERL